MESENNGVCPVCTLYLRPGITLKSHLNSHPKQKVIEALVNLTNLRIDNNKSPATTTSSEIAYQPQLANRIWNQSSSTFPNIPIPPANHSFIYQQFMSTSQPPSNQQYVTVPTVFNPSMMCPPYVYQQQQQVFMSSSALPASLVESKTPVIDLSIRQDVCEDLHTDIDIHEDDSKKGGLTDSADNEITPGSPTESEAIEEEKEEDIDSPSSSGTDFIRIRQDLNKACQTRQENDNYAEEHHDVEASEGFEFYCDSDMNVVQSNDQVLDLTGVQLVLCNDFMGGQVISQVQDFQCNNGQPVVMNFGADGYENNLINNNLTSEQFRDDNASQGSVTNLSIRADENMPPRGELSGQESNGATSDVITWNRAHCESNSAASYDLFARETWEGSDGSDYETSRLQCPTPIQTEELDDTPTIIRIIEAPLNFKCPTCGKGFKCPKERKNHQTEEHSKNIAEKTSNSGINVVGAKVQNKTTVKKLVIRPKRTAEIKNEASFEDAFINTICEAGNNTETQDFKGGMPVNVEQEQSNTIEDEKNIKSFECSACGITHPDLQSFKKHKQFVHGRSTRFKCDTCRETMKDQRSYTEHLKKHPLECKLCGKYFYRRQNLQLHMKRHLGIKPFMCEFCQKKFFSKQKLLEHRNTHTGEAPIKCNMCDDTFRRYSNLVQHRNLHHFNIKKKVKDYICHCGEVLHTKKKLAWHKEIHDAKPKACTKCNEKFIHMASLTRHMRRSHNDRFVPEETRTSENVECPICNNIYLKSSLEAHIRRHSGVKGFSCTICNKEFTTKWNLKLHKWIHASRASKPFKCDHCKAAFIRETDFTAHMNSHKCVRPYTCNHCGAQFIRKSNCQRHVKEHERDKTFTCQICGKAFHRSYYLKDHMRVHSGVRPFACHICGKTSTTKSNHNKHVMIHHAKEPISTEN